MPTRVALYVLVVLAVARNVPGASDDWPWFRGPSFDGKAVGEAPLVWSESRNVVWKVAVSGRGHSSPVVGGDRIYLTTSDESAKTQSVLCYGRDSGSLLWEKELHRGGFGPRHPQNSQASPTAAFDGERVFVLFPNADALHVSALSPASGELQWQQRLAPFRNGEGCGSSPVIYGDLVIVLGDNRKGSFVVALKRKSGELAWRQKRITDGSFCSPVVAHLAGRPQLLVSGIRATWSYDPATGESLWHCKGPATATANSVGFSDDATGYVLASGGAPEKEMLCVRADGSGDVNETHVLWRTSRNITYVPSPVYRDGYFYVVNDHGIAQCLEAASGTVIWRKRLGDRFKASLILVGDRIYAASEGGTTHVFAARPEFERLAENTLSEGTVATPAICGGRLYLRTYHHLYCLGDLDAQGGAASLGPRTVEFPSISYNGVHHVSMAGSDATGDGTREKPWASIGHALSSIRGVKFDSRHAVVVSAGVYREPPITMRSDIDLYGGFGPSRWERDIQRNQTVIDGQKRDRVIIGADSTRLDGFVVTGGRSSGGGGAMLVDDAAMIMSNNIFVDNGTLKPDDYRHGRTQQQPHDGGAILCLYDAAPVISHNLFVKNFTEVGQGGALAFVHEGRRSDGTSPDVRLNVFFANDSGRKGDPSTRGSNGGAVSCSFGAAPVIEQNAFVQNVVRGRRHGGAIHAELFATPTVRSNWFVGNTSKGDGGAIHIMRDAEALIEKNVFMGNGAVSGGGVRLITGGRGRIRNNVFAYASSGGAVTCDESWMEFANNTVMQNRGSAVHSSNGTDHLRRSVLVNNIIRSDEARALTFEGEKPLVSYCVVQGGFNGEGNFDAEPLFLEDSVEGVARIRYDEATFVSTLNLEGNAVPVAGLVGRSIRVGENWGLVRSGSETHGTISVWGNMDRGLESAEPAPFLVPMTYHLAAGSPCIGKASTQRAPERDIDDDRRRFELDQSVDIGADER